MNDALGSLWIKIYFPPKKPTSVIDFHFELAAETQCKLNSNADELERFHFDHKYFYAKRNFM